MRSEGSGKSFGNRSSFRRSASSVRSSIVCFILARDSLSNVPQPTSAIGPTASG